MRSYQAPNNTISTLLLEDHPKVKRHQKQKRKTNPQPEFSQSSARIQADLIRSHQVMSRSDNVNRDRQRFDL